jgi:hypothetical protein
MIQYSHVCGVALKSSKQQNEQHAFKNATEAASAPVAFVDDAPEAVARLVLARAIALDALRDLVVHSALPGQGVVSLQGSGRQGNAVLAGPRTALLLQALTGLFALQAAAVPVPAELQHVALQ